MSFKYKGKSVSGVAWKRANSVTIYNDYEEVPRVMFSEETVVEVDGSILKRPAGDLTILIDDDTAAETFPVLNPDGSESGEVSSVAYIGQLLTSAYVHFANLRDQMKEQEEEDEPTEEEEEEAPEEGEEPTEGEEGKGSNED